MKYVIRAAGIAICAVLALGAWAIFFDGDNSGFIISNNTNQKVRVTAFSQSRPAFPGAFDIEDHGTKQMQGDWLPADDPEAACFLTGVAGKDAQTFHTCLKMPTRDDARDTFKVSEGDQAPTKQQCLDLSAPGLP